MSAYKLLVVEDSKPQALAAKMSLTRGGYDVALAMDGQEGLEKATAERYDLIITDINMPRMDGYQMCERLKAEDNTRDIPIVITTTRNKADDIIRGLEVGAINFITKPFDQKILVEKVGRVIEASKNGGTRQEKSLKLLKSMMEGSSEKTQIFETLFEAFGQIFECRMMGILLTDQGSGDLLFLMSPERYPEGPTTDFVDSLLEEYNHDNPHENPIMEGDCRKFVVVQDPDVEARDAGKFRSTLYAPLYSKGVIIGHIGIAHTTADMYTDDDVKMLCALALQAAEALKNFEI